MSGKQGVGKFARTFEVKGKIVKVGNSYSFIPSGKGKAVVTGLTEANLKGVSGKAKQLLSKLTGQPQKEAYLGLDLFDVQSGGVARKLPTKFRGADVYASNSFGIFNPKVSTYATYNKQTKSILNQLIGNVKAGGDPIVSSLFSPQFSKGKLSLSTSKKADVVSILFEKPTPVKAVGFKGAGKKSSDEFLNLMYKVEKPKVKPRIIEKQYTPTDSLIQVEKPRVKTRTSSRTTQSPQLDFLQEGFAGSQRNVIKPFTFTPQTGRISSELALGLGLASVSRVRGASGVRSAVDVASVQRSLTGQVSRQVSKQGTKQGLKSTSVNVNAPITSLVGGVAGFGGFRPFGFPSILPKSRPGPGQQRRRVPTKKKKKSQFQVDTTGFGSYLGVSDSRSRKKKKKSDVTGFELF
jgi:hypothetical protein